MPRIQRHRIGTVVQQGPPTEVIEAEAKAKAEAAVDAEIAGRELVEESDPRISKARIFPDDIAYARVFADGKRSFMEMDSQGKPTAWAAQLIREAIGSVGVTPDIAYARVFADGKRSFVEFDSTGRPTAWSAALIREALDRLGEDGLPAGDVNLLQPLDIWAPFGASGYEWPAATYAEYISGIDAKLAGAGATKRVVGTAADGATPIHAYQFGPADAPHALIVGGIHGQEMAGPWAAMRYFTEFVRNDHPVMAALRRRLQITFIPALNSSRYRQSRTNPNGVNLNRNFPFFWDYAADSDKGPAPFSEPEAQIIKTLLDEHDIACVIDCHMGSASDPAIAYVPPSSWTSAGRRVTWGAASWWDQHANPEGYSVAEYIGTAEATKGPPIMTNWAAKYLRYHKGRLNAATLTMEADAGELGSSSNGYMSAGGTRAYAGFIHAFIALWLTQGQVPDSVQPHRWTAQRTYENSATTLAAGGSRLTGTLAAISFDRMPDGSVRSQAASLPWIDVPLRSPGEFAAEVDLVVEAADDASGRTRVELAVGWGRSPEAGGNMEPDTTPSMLAWVDLGGPGARATLHRTYQLPDLTGITDDNPLHRLQVFLRAVEGDAVLKSARVAVTHHPTPDIDPRPAIVRTR